MTFLFSSFSPPPKPPTLRMYKVYGHISQDETPDRMSRKVVQSVLITGGKVYLLDVQCVLRQDAVAVLQTLNHAESKLDTYYVLSFSCDSASYNFKAFKEGMKDLFPNAVMMPCIMHLMHRRIETLFESPGGRVLGTFAQKLSGSVKDKRSPELVWRLRVGLLAEAEKKIAAADRAAKEAAAVLEGDRQNRAAAGDLARAVADRAAGAAAVAGHQELVEDLEDLFGADGSDSDSSSSSDDEFDGVAFHPAENELEEALRGSFSRITRVEHSNLKGTGLPPSHGAQRFGSLILILKWASSNMETFRGTLGAMQREKPLTKRQRRLWALLEDGHPNVTCLNTGEKFRNAIDYLSDMLTPVLQVMFMLEGRNSLVTSVLDVVEDLMHGVYPGVDFAAPRGAQGQAGGWLSGEVMRLKEAVLDLFSDKSEPYRYLVAAKVLNPGTVWDRLVNGDGGTKPSASRLAIEIMQELSVFPILSKLFVTHAGQMSAQVNRFF